MKRRTLVGIGCGFLVLAVFWLWYVVAANFNYGALAGTYVYKGPGETCTLYLRSDRTFVEELNRSGRVEKSEGQWDRYGEAHVSLSKEFVKLTAEELNASGQAHGQFDKTLGLFPRLVLAPLPDGPTFHKKWFR